MNCGECEHIYINKYNNYACSKIGGPVISLDTPACRDNFEVNNGYKCNAMDSNYNDNP